MLIRLQEIVDDRLCHGKVRELRWQEGVLCPHCGSSSYRRHGHHHSTEHRYRYCQYQWVQHLQLDDSEV
jgi:transposase-like protein